MTAQLTLALPEQAVSRNFGEKGRRAWFWQDGSWQVGRAWEARADGKIAGMCRDYGPWGTTYAGRGPLETHGLWKPHQVSWKKPAEQHVGPRRAGQAA